MTSDYSELIERTLVKAPKYPDGKSTVCSAPLPNSMVLCIEYHTENGINVYEDDSEMTPEHFDWKKAGCKNNEEWRRYLNHLFWSEYNAGL